MKKLLTYFLLAAAIGVVSCSDEGDSAIDTNIEGKKNFSFDEESLKAFIAENDFKRFVSDYSDKKFATEAICAGSGSYEIDNLSNSVDYIFCYYYPEYYEDDFFIPEHYVMYGIKELDKDRFVQLSIAFVNFGIPQTGNYRSNIICGITRCDYRNSVFGRIGIYTCNDNSCFTERYFYSDDWAFNVDVTNQQGKINVSFSDMEFYLSDFWPFYPSDLDEQYYNGMEVSANLECCLED